MYPILSSGVRKTRPQEREIPGGEKDLKAFSLVGTSGRGASWVGGLA